MSERRKPTAPVDMRNKRCRSSDAGGALSNDRGGRCIVALQIGATHAGSV